MVRNLRGSGRPAGRLRAPVVVVSEERESMLGIPKRYVQLVLGAVLTTLATLAATHVPDWFATDGEVTAAVEAHDHLDGPSTPSARAPTAPTT